jgi:hypothetical protein
MSSKADSDLAQLGAELAAAIVTAIPDWIRKAVSERVIQWVQAGGGPVRVEEPELLEMCEAAGEQAAQKAAGPLEDLLLSDVDQQWTTPLAIVRPLVAFASDVLEVAGVPEVVRDDFQVSRFPDDRHGLTPASLAALGGDVAELALIWGAAKALAHRQRHAT